MSYLKGKDIKVPFDCLWHYYTRKFNIFYENNPHALSVDGMTAKISMKHEDKPEDFEGW